ncbi:MG2 domain-containing protein [Verrucomicrobiales bacterium]|nr:MG2 domain-containing protein [Verrucomicrobiales bacterium]
MKPYQTFLCCWFVTILGLHAQRATSTDLARRSTEVVLTPPSSDLAQGSRFVISFPEAMIPLDQVDIADATSPLMFTPPIPGAFSWQSTTTGTYRVTGPVKPGQVYEVDLTADLEVSRTSWRASEFQAPSLEITSRFRSRGISLSASPRVDLRTNYRIHAAKAAETAYFQNRETRQRYPVSVILPEVDVERANERIKVPDTLSRFHVTSAEPLPVGATYELVIDGLTDAGTGTPMLALKSISLGSTQALTISEVETITHPLDKPAVILSTTAPVDHDSLSSDSVRVTPPVENVTFFADDYDVRVKGDFDPSTTYEIALGPEVTSKTGYPIANPGPHKATFDGLTPIIVFPRSHFYQRSALGLNVTILQSNCPETTWRLAAIPLERFAVIESRLREHERAARDPFTGKIIGDFQTELLTDAFDLEITATGTLPGTAAHEARYQDIRWQPQDGNLPVGAYLLETSATLADGRVIGNRCMLYFNELVIHRKFTNTTNTLKTFAMTDGNPVPGATVKVLDRKNAVLGEGVTDNEGLLSLSRLVSIPEGMSRPTYILIKSEQGNGIQPYWGARFISSGYTRRTPTASHDNAHLLSHTFTDRNLYRPGDTVHVKGTTRWQTVDRPSIPTGKIGWSIQEGWNGPIVASGETDLDDFGGWDATWDSAKTAKIGRYTIETILSGKKGQSVGFQIEEYKPPLFNVALSETEDDQIQVKSHYFHGAPNAGAKLRWQAYWSPSYRHGGDIGETDHHSPFQHEVASSTEREGEASLDADGMALVSLEIPYEKPWVYGRYQVQFRADIISPEGRVISSSNHTIIRPHSHYAAIQWTRASDDTPNDPALIAKAFAFDRQDREQVGLPVELTIYRRNTQTVKERLGSNVYRYRNYPNYHRIKTIAIKSGDSYPFTPEETGHYIAYAKLTENPTAPAVSTTIHSVGDGVGSYDVYNDGEITLQLDKKRYLAGQDIAQIALEAPFGGQAWVTVETNRIIDQFLVNLPANNQTISLPIKPSYHPNVHVSVYLLHPGGLDRLPMERYGTTDITVDRPDLVLDVQPILTESSVQPGEDVTGLVRVHCQGQPVPGADLTILAVDDSVHRLSNWQMPDWFSQVYPKRYLGVAAYRGLGDHVSKFEGRDVTEKGFIIGGGVDDAFSPADSAHSESPQSFRKDFRALAFWKTQVRTNANGEATFEFTAPDNLTSYHLVAIAQTKKHQFGQGESYLKVAKRLMVEPALTRFVRRGDQIELRAVVRQNYVDNAQVTIQCQVEGEIEWLIGSQNATIGLSKGLPQVVRFPCRILGGDAIKVSFQAHCEDEPSLKDAVELELPVRLPGIIQRTGHYGIISKKDASFPLYEKLPESWNSTIGTYDMTVSHTPYLPELNSMPEILEYPHGCFEQKATRYLSYTQMLSLLDYLPELKNRHANYRDRLQEGLAEYENAQLESGFIPYWSGGREPNDWVTVMAYWLTKSAKSQGVTVSVGLEAGLDKSFQTIVHGRRKKPDIHLTTRTFALFAYAETGHAVDGMQALITDLYARRGELSLDGLTLLTLAMNRFGVMEKEQAQLAKVLENEARERQRDFEPVTFGSLYRDQALRWLTKTRLASLQERRNLSEAFLKHLEDQGTVTLSTQEHFWKTLLLKEFVEIEKDGTFDQDQIQPSPDYVSANLVSIAWKTQPLEHLRDLKLDLATGNADRHYFIRAALLRGGDVSVAEDRGFRLERVVTNLTDPKRVGTEETPYQIGDELLLGYRFHTRKHHYYVALSDELPAGIETVNFNLPQIAQVYKLPGEAQPSIALDHSELRDQSANLYFDHVLPGNHRYAILARVTAAGSFAWPSTQISPMYQPHVGGLTASSNAHSRHGR